MEAPQGYYTNWQEAGLQAPERPADLRDWLQTVGLQPEEDYKIDPRVEKISMGLGWDKGVDIDASAGLFDQKGTLVDLVWWHKLQSNDKSIKHSGDDRTGEGGGDDEVITVDIPQIPLRIHHILFAVCIYSEGYSFHQVRQAYVRMMNGKPKHNGHVMANFSLTDMTGHAMLMGLMTRKGAFWSFKALGLPASGRTMQQIVDVRPTIPSLFSASRQFPGNLTCLQDNPSHPPPLRRISVSVVQGKSLAASDSGGMFGRASSDPYYVIKFRKRTAKSPHQSKTLDPKWKESPFLLGLLTEAESKAVKIAVFDYDAVSEDDFLGMVWIPGNALFNLGPGQHDIWFTLGPSKEPKHRKAVVSGQILLSVNVVEMS